MCITSIYVDRYPDGREVEFRHLSNCQYGKPGRPCRTHSNVENPVRMIQYGDAPTQTIASRTIYPSSPPLSSTSSQNRHSGDLRRPSRSPSRSDDGRLHVNRSPLKPGRQHRRERIIVVDAPPTPTTPPKLFGTFTAPSSPDPKGRPIIVDERPRHRDPSPNHLSPSRPAFGWDIPSTSHTNFDLRAEREREEREREERMHHDRARLERRLRKDREAPPQVSEEARKARAIADANNDIKRRAAVPIPPVPAPMPARQRTYLRPVVDQTQALQLGLGGAAPVAMEADEAMRQRLRERQMPKRRSTVGPGHRRPRAEYNDGVYRWE